MWVQMYGFKMMFKMLFFTKNVGASCYALCNNCFVFHNDFTCPEVLQPFPNFKMHLEPIFQNCYKTSYNYEVIHVTYSQVQSIQ